MFAVHGIPDIVMSDNGPQFSSELFSKFAATYGFIGTTSSPRYPQSNGEVERAVQTVKDLLKKNEDPYLALLTYRSTPLQNNLSPSELLMGRRLRTQLPVLPNTLRPRLQDGDLQKVRKREEIYRSNQKRNFDLRHKTRELPTLQSGDKVWIRDQNRNGQILRNANQPRSYIVQTEQGTVRRNRKALVSTSQPEIPLYQPDQPTSDSREKQHVSPVKPQHASPVKPQHASPVKPQHASPVKPQHISPKKTPNKPVVQTRYGRIIKPPDRLISNI
jgi:hypothetical protein